MYESSLESMTSSSLLKTASTFDVVVVDDAVVVGGDSVVTSFIVEGIASPVSGLSSPS